MRDKLLVLTAIAVTMGWQAVYGQELQRAPINPAFLAGRATRLTTVTADGRRLGKRPTPFNWSHMREPDYDQPRATALPARYDLREQGRLTDIRDQNPYGTCWAFAALASVESCLMPQENHFFRSTIWYSMPDLTATHMMAAAAPTWRRPIWCAGAGR